MTTNSDRWRQRLQNQNSAYEHLKAACVQATYNRLIRTFEFTFELAWKTMKDRLEFESYEVRSPRETIRRALEMNLIDDAAPWLRALESRDLFNHTYNDGLSTEQREGIRTVLEGEAIALDDLLGLKAKLSGLNLPIEVDLVIRAKITNPALEEHIRTHGREWWKRNGLQEVFS